jgi:hypothetical protein
LGEYVTAKITPAFTATVAATQFSTVEGTYTGSTDRRYWIEVVGGGATDATQSLRIYDAGGAEVPVVYNVVDGNSSVPMGAYGLTFDIATDGDLCKGDKFYVDIVAAKTSSSEFVGVRLDGPVLDTSHEASALTVSVFQPYTGLLDAAGTADATSYTYDSALGLSAALCGATYTPGIGAFADTIGSVYLSYKAAVIPGSQESTVAITRADTMESLVGPAHIENWLGRGVAEAFSGSQGLPVYAVRTLDDTVESFNTALKKLRTTDIYYAITPMTDRMDVKLAVIAHCDEMSNKYNKNFRRCYVGTDSPGEYVQLGAINSYGELRTCGVSNRLLTLDESHRESATFAQTDVGSFITCEALSAYGAQFEILEVVSDYELIIDINVAATTTVSGFSLVRSDTADNVVRFLQETAAELNSRRCVNVWSDLPTYTSSTGSQTLPMKFVAAEIAGLRCALLPQQGLTMTEVNSITSAPAMYTRFDQTQLDDIAAAGNLVVTQDSEGGEVYIRHQLTTRTDSGSLAYEDNVGVIVDTFSYSVKDMERGFIGKKNATRTTIELLRSRLYGIAVAATKTDLAGIEIGPMVIRFFDEDGKEDSVTVRVDDVLADTFVTYVKLRVPLPLNGIDNYIDVEASTLL